MWQLKYWQLYYAFNKYNTFVELWNEGPIQFILQVIAILFNYRLLSPDHFAILGKPIKYFHKETQIHLTTKNIINLSDN